MKFGKDNRRKNHANERIRTASGRIAGHGIIYDNYSEDSCPSVYLNPGYVPDRKVDFRLSDEEKDFRNHGGPVVTYTLKGRG